MGDTFGIAVIFPESTANSDPFILNRNWEREGKLKLFVLNEWGSVLLLHLTPKVPCEIVLSINFSKLLALRRVCVVEKSLKRQ